MDKLCEAAGPWVRTAVDGLTVTVRAAAEREVSPERSATLA
jgi:hypothetical protein